MPSILVHGRPALQNPESGRAAAVAARPQSILALILALSFSSACTSCAPASGSSSVAGDGSGGSSGSITISPLGDTYIGPQDDFELASVQRTFMLANETNASVSWEARLSKRWLSLAGPERGVLAPGSSIRVPVNVHTNAVSHDEAEPAVAEVSFLDSDTATILGIRTVTVAWTVTGSDTSGWTTFVRSADTRTVFVSSSTGNDQSDGLSPATAKRTIASGAALLRHGFPDWLLLMRGDVWHEGLGQWKKSGRAESEPMLVSTYGDAAARPLLETGSVAGISTSGSGGSPAHIDNLAIVGLHFHADGFTGVGDCVGAHMLQPGSHFLIEDCEFQGYSTNLVFQGFGGRHSDFRLRRSVIVDAHSVHGTGGHPQGLYAYAVDGLLIEENVFDHNGWSETIPGAGADIYSHNLYIDNTNTGVVVRGNIIANASSHGMQLRPGGSVVNNLFLRNSIALSVGGGNDPEPGGVTADVRGNVILEGKNIDAANPRGWGLWFANIASGHVANNIVANNSFDTQPVMIVLAGTHTGDSHPSIGVHDLLIEQNVFYDWGGVILVEGDSAQVSNVAFQKNDVQNRDLPDPLIHHSHASSTASFHSSENHFFSRLVRASSWTEIESVPHNIQYWMSQVGDTTSAAQQVDYVDPSRSVASYNALLGGRSTSSSFLTEARKQSSRNWRPEYTAARVDRYIRGGF